VVAQRGFVKGTYGSIPAGLRGIDVGEKVGRREGGGGELEVTRLFFVEVAVEYI
jgi:hypothetical protein